MPLPVWNPSVSYVCNHRDWFSVNPDYQREPNVWTPADKRYLIDTILRDLDVPKFYVRKLGEKRFEIVDGQQRMITIWEFRDGNFPLSGKISGGALDGAKYADLPGDLVERFDNFTLNCVLLEGYDDPKIRELFGRLQRGKTLNPAEKLNAKPGTITPLMRSLARHLFMQKTAFSLKRYKTYHIAAQLMLLGSKGINDISPQPLYDFFDANVDLDETSDTAKKARRVLDYLDRTFPEQTPELDSNTWVVDLFTLVSDLRNKYVIEGREEDLRRFFIEFWRIVEIARRTSAGDKDIVDFAFASSAGTTGKTRIEKRFAIMKERFLVHHMDLVLLDPRREFDRFEKVVIYRRDGGVCQSCGIKVEWKQYEADHVQPHSKGGPTTIENGQVLCASCNAAKRANAASAHE